MTSARISFIYTIAVYYCIFTSESTLAIHSNNLIGTWKWCLQLICQVFDPIICQYDDTFCNRYSRYTSTVTIQMLLLCINLAVLINYTCPFCLTDGFLASIIHVYLHCVRLYNYTLFIDMWYFQKQSIIYNEHFLVLKKKP